MIVDKTVAEDDGGASGASPRIKVMVENSLFTMFTFGWGEDDHMTSLDDITNVKILKGEYAPTLAADFFDVNSVCHGVNFTGLALDCLSLILLGNGRKSLVVDNNNTSDHLQ